MYTKWPLACVTEIHAGIDERVRVVTVRTSKGTYNRPITTIVPLGGVYTKTFSTKNEDFPLRLGLPFTLK